MLVPISSVRWLGPWGSTSDLNRKSQECTQSQPRLGPGWWVDTWSWVPVIIPMSPVSSSHLFEPPPPTTPCDHGWTLALIRTFGLLSNTLDFLPTYRHKTLAEIWLRNTNSTKYNTYFHFVLITICNPMLWAPGEHVMTCNCVNHFRKIDDSHIYYFSSEGCPPRDNWQFWRIKERHKDLCHHENVLGIIIPVRFITMRAVLC